MIEIQIAKPHAGQQKLDQALADARFGVVMCGRRFGKTKYGIYRAASEALKGRKVGWFAPTYKYASEAWRELSHRLRPACRKSNDQQMRLETLNGGILECWTMDSPDPGRGRAYHLAVIDEAGIVRDLDVIWQQAIRPTLTDYVGRALFLGTPKGRTHAFSQLFAKGQSGETEWRSVRAPTTDNPYMKLEEIEAARRDLPPAVFAQEYEGVPTDDGGNPFGLTAISQCFHGPEEQDSLPAAWGWDFARAQDWTVGVALDADGNVLDLQRFQDDWVTQYQRIQTATQCCAAGDATGVGDPIVQTLQARGVQIDPVMFTPKSKQDLMLRLRGALHTKQIRIPDTPRFQVLRGELESFTYEYTANGVRYSAPDGLHDDCVMALALAIHAYDRWGFAYKPALVAPDRSHQLWQADKDSAYLIRDPEQFTDHFPGGIPGVGF